MATPNVFVCGITGTQGGFVARELLQRGAHIHALARDMSAPKAKEFAALGAQLWAGDFDNKDAIHAAIQGCSAIFLNFYPNFQDSTADLRWAKSLLVAARAAGVKHAIFSSGLTVNAPEKLTRWDPNTLTASFLLSKQAIEKEVINSGLEFWTIIRPGNFYTNYVMPAVSMYPGLRETGVVQTALQEDTKLPCIDPITIGKFVAAAIFDPAKFHAQELEIADETKTYGEILEKISTVVGRDLKLVYLDDEAINAQIDNPFLVGQLLARELLNFIDMDKVGTWGVPLSSLEVFVQREKDRLLETYQLPA
ncbi:hypothetical protein B0I35DRAFT_479437 [Stachybotrys elegans]|uniref:NmrA-like domain-containing protein n=1 Tax=Stachybotrys elegans TaxID=80388 RepID=A0A8K0WQA1_9HYPO|nr:hypothetical protein B0I35DRAFT_479437 [Stachybotrys elegans]